MNQGAEKYHNLFASQLAFPVITGLERKIYLIEFGKAQICQIKSTPAKILGGMIPKIQDRFAYLPNTELLHNYPKHVQLHVLSSNHLFGKLGRPSFVRMQNGC